MVARGEWPIAARASRARDWALLLARAVRSRAASQSQVVHEKADEREETDQDDPEHLRADADVMSFDDAVPHHEQNEDPGDQRDGREQIHGRSLCGFHRVAELHAIAVGLG